MSYILDALRRADAERERDPARGIHAQPAAVLPARARVATAPWGWAVAGCAVVAAAAAGVLWLRAASPAAPAVSGPVLRAPAPLPVPVPQPAPALAVVQVADAVSPPAPPPLPAPAPAVMASRSVAKPAAVPAAAQAAAPAAILKAPAAADPGSRVFAVGDLPPEIQRELPKLAISGGVHSENAAQRLLVVGGQLKTEGAELAPGVVLEQIRPRNAVLRFRGFRYSVQF